MAILSPSGLCLACAATDRTAEPTPLEFLPASPTVTAAREPGTATACAVLARAAMPHAPPGYELLDRLGSGGMGSVYLAREQASERLVAMKFLHHPGDQASFERFLVELRILAQLDHPNIVGVFSSDFLRADPFFTMEHLSGGSLSRAIEEGAPAPIPETVRLIRTVADAVAAAHAKGVIHRDLKPSNILLAANGTPKVSDFGLAKRLEHDDKLTPASGALGTASYMPPEQVSRRNGEIGPWSDVYGLGATLYHLLTGRAPFLGDTMAETIIQVLADPPARPRAVRADIPAALEGIVVKCLEKDPKDRYQSMAELSADLDRFLAGQKPAAPPLTPARCARRWVARNRRGFAAGVAALFLVAAFGLGVAYWSKPPDPGEEKAKRLRAINDGLRAGKPVTLVGERGEPLWYEAPTGPVEFAENPTRTETDPGGCYFKSNGVTILKLLDPPIDRYTVELQIQHVNGAVTDRPPFGFFLGYQFTLCPDNWREHSLLSVGFDDHDKSPFGQPPTPSPVGVASYRFVATPGQLPQPQHFGIVEKSFEGVRTFPGRWRKVTVAVSPERLRISWEPTAGKSEELADWSAADIRGHRADHDRILGIVGARIGHNFAPSPDWSPQQAIGLWASDAEIAIKNVVVTPH